MGELVEDDAADDGAPRRPAQQLLWQLKVLALLAVALVVIGFGSGWLFGQNSSAAAARRLLEGQVVEEPADEGTGDAAAPTSGAAGGQARCGEVAGPLPPAEQVAVLQLGGAVIQYRPGDIAAADVGVLREVLSTRASHLVLAPNPRLDAPVVATALERRLRLDEVDATRLRAFVVGYAAPTGPPSDCPVG